MIFAANCLLTLSERVNESDKVLFDLYNLDNTSVFVNECVSVLNVEVNLDTASLEDSVSVNVLTIPLTLDNESIIVLNASVNVLVLLCFLVTVSSNSIGLNVVSNNRESKKSSSNMVYPS